LRCLDLALLAEVDAFESTLWDEGAQRLQGLAISPDEVRTLLHVSAPVPAPRQSGELKRRRQRAQDVTARRLAATAGRPDAPPFVRLIDRFELGPFEQFVIAATLAVEIDRNKYGKAYALLQDDVTRKQPSLELLLRLYAGADDTDRWSGAVAFDSAHPLLRWGLQHHLADASRSTIGSRASCSDWVISVQRSRISSRQLPGLRPPYASGRHGISKTGSLGS
jgi:hypothetical protein